MRRRVDPFLLSFLESIEQELAIALEASHRRQETREGDASLAMRHHSERIATLRSAIDAVQVAIERREIPIVH
jgi:hypothetical protein